MTSHRRPVVASVDGDRSFAALVHGGQDNQLGAARPDGLVRSNDWALGLESVGHGAHRESDGQPKDVRGG